MSQKLGKKRSRLGLRMLLRKLAVEHGSDHADYTDVKTSFIESVPAKADIDLLVQRFRN